MFRCWVILFVAGVTVSSSAIARAEDDWKAAARKQQLNSSQIETLARDKIVVSDWDCMQVFTPYVNLNMPAFITSDSILNAYHILLEESVLQMEQANSRALPEILQSLWTNLESADKPIRGRPELVARAKLRAQIVLGTALELLDGKPVGADKKIAAIIRDEVARVEAAAGQSKPSWLGPVDDPELIVIDYSRYKPRGFYSQTNELSRYFRAVAWLQSIPFRVNNDEELLAILMLGRRAGDEVSAGKGAKPRQLRDFFECFRNFLGDRDDLDLTIAAAAAPRDSRFSLDAGGLEKVRQSLLAKLKQVNHPSQINDQIAYLPVPTSFRILSAYRLPDAILFQRTTDPQVFHRPLPSGLEVCIALGSARAARCLNDPERQRVVEVIERSKPMFSGANLYCDYLHCLSTLFDAPSARAPAFMSGEAWQAKSCTTALAGWAQLRHTWMLQAKQTYQPAAADEPVKQVGFVEPNPAFFRALGRLAARTARLFEGVKTQDNSQYYALAELQNLVQFMDERVTQGRSLDDRNDVSSSQSVRQYMAINVLQQVVGRFQPEMSPAKTRVFVAKAMPKVKAAVDDVRQGKADARQYLSGVTRGQFDVADLWRQLADLSGRLRDLAEKQLTGAAFTADERQLIQDYGNRLAKLTFHIGSCCETPRDDVPRIADVAYNPNTGDYLEVGIGRPKLMYLLYPTASGEVLCQGAVMPYFQFRSATRLDDSVWMMRLDSPDPLRPLAPVQPSSIDWANACAWTVGIVTVCVFGIICWRSARSPKFIK